jgi:hypothetical protein
MSNPQPPVPDQAVDTSAISWPGSTPRVEPALVGAVDMHVHGYPDVGLEWRQRTDDLTLVRSARDAGMAGIVLKSHFWPTMDRALILANALDDPSFAIHSSITLNPLIGGIQPTTVEAAAAHGAKVVFMPTWGSVNDHAHGGVVRRQVIDKILPSMGPYLDRSAVTILDSSGGVHPEAREVLHVAKELGLVVSTGHLSTAESVKLVEAAADIGHDRMLFAHPFSPSINASATLIEDVAAAGAVVEMTAVLTMMPNAPVHIEDVYELVQKLGSEHVVISSDVFFDWLPPHAEMLRMVIGQLRALGTTDAELRNLFVDNPRRLLAP